ncbi:MAG: tetratricopeptide repeat protein [Pseudomonadota bacterium]
MRQTLLHRHSFLALSAMLAASYGWSSTAAVAQSSNGATQAMQSKLGNYLAGRIARGQNNTRDAARFYGNALKRAPGSPAIIERAFMMKASEGQFEDATELAKSLITRKPTHRLARLWLGTAAFIEKDYKRADRHFRASASGPIAELTATLARGWTSYAAGNGRKALRALSSQNQAEWAQFYSAYHRALVADLVGARKTSAKSFRAVVQKDLRAPRTAIAFARSLAKAGDRDGALAVMRRYVARSGGVGHPASNEIIKLLESNAPVDRLISSPRDGLAEVFYGLGEALATEGGGTPLGMVYLQLALSLQPEFPFALASLANVYETVRDFERANETYSRIPDGTPFQGPIEIRKALNLNSLEQVEKARKLLVAKIKREPQNLEAIEALANMLRSRKRYEEAIVYYSKAIDLVGKPTSRDWTYWYARGTCYERTKQWPKAEADLLKAKGLKPNQPLILNYLGYSWVDQNQRLDEGLDLIKSAVKLKPDDGYIVDSLGWAYYRLGDISKAVKHLERAVELKPEDPILNDHLGDALWRAGRHREARYQWELALWFKPEPEEIIKIRGKLSRGLPGKAFVRKTDTKTGVSPVR